MQPVKAPHNSECIRADVNPAFRDPEQWFAVQVVPQHEKKVAALLEYKGVQQFLPLQRVTSQWSDRIKAIDRPLFPNYVFCRTRQVALRSVLVTPGVVRIVGFGGRPYPVQEDEIAAIEKIISTGCRATPVERPTIGERVQIQEGPLKGIIGTVTRINNQHHLVIFIESIMKFIAVGVDEHIVTLPKTA